MDTESSELLNKLHKLAEKENLSGKKLAEMLHVSQNTISNWNNGGTISPAKKRAIEFLLHQSPVPIEINDRLSAMMFELWQILPDYLRAKVFAYAMEMNSIPREDDYASRIPQKDGFLQSVAEPPAEYKRGK